MKDKDCIIIQTSLYGLAVLCSYLGEVYYEQPTQSSGISHFHVQDLPPKHLACGYSYSSVPDRLTSFLLFFFAAKTKCRFFLQYMISTD